MQFKTMKARAVAAATLALGLIAGTLVLTPAVHADDVEAPADDTVVAQDSAVAPEDTPADVGDAGVGDTTEGESGEGEDAATDGTDSDAGEPTIVTEALSDGQVGVAYSFTLEAEGDDPVAFAATGLPTGLSLDGATGEIFGTPTEDGEFTVEVTATSSAGSATASYSVSVAPAEDPMTAVFGDITRDSCVVTIPVATTGIGTFILTVWDDGVEYEKIEWTTTESPATEDVVWIITRAAMESVPGVGFVITVSGGGELANYDPYEYPADVADNCAEEASSPPEIVSGDLPDGTVGEDYDFTVVAEGAEPIEFSAEGLPDGLEIDPATGEITGVPTVAGMFTVDVTAANEFGSDTVTYEVVIAAVQDPMTAVIGDITRDQCEVTIPVATTGVGTFVLTVWDDGVEYEKIEWTTTESPADEDVVWTITRPALESAPGVGFIVVTADGQHMDMLDPYEYPASVANDCGGVTEEPPAKTPGKTVVDQEPLAVTGVDAGWLQSIVGAAVLIVLSGTVLMAVRRRA